MMADSMPPLITRLHADKLDEGMAACIMQVPLYNHSGQCLITCMHAHWLMVEAHECRIAASSCSQLVMRRDDQLVLALAATSPQYAPLGCNRVWKMGALLAGRSLSSIM